jgi:uncharacterized membrane protein YraQ (UPF0718 family)
MGVARIIGAVSFAIIIGSIMAIIYRKEEKVKAAEQMNIQLPPEVRPMWQTSFHFFILVLILVFANWGKPTSDDTSGAWYFIWSNKWVITSIFGLGLVYSLIKILKIKWWLVIAAAVATGVSGVLASTYIGGSLAPLVPMLVAITGLSIITLQKDDENRKWTLASWDFAKQIMPLLALGVIVAGFLLGSTHDTTSIPGVIPSSWISSLVGGNSIFSNFFASIVGAFMYFATLTEVPIVQGLLSSGMGKGPALALLLAGPSLSLPNMLVIRGVMGTQKTLVYVLLVVVMATLSGMIYGAI